MAIETITKKEYVCEVCGERTDVKTLSNTWIKGDISLSFIKQRYIEEIDDFKSVKFINVKEMLFCSAVCLIDYIDNQLKLYGE